MYHQKSHHINKDNLIKQLNSYMLTDDFIEKIEFDSEKESNEEYFDILYEPELSWS